MPFEFKNTRIPGVRRIIKTVYPDNRGSFAENYVRADFVANGIGDNFVQFNESISQKNVFRGMHIQYPSAQSKLVQVVQGAVLDVVTDVRPNSTTFKKTAVFLLSNKKPDMLYIQTGFLHGFLALENDTVFMYFCGAYYNKKESYTINWLDPELGIRQKLLKKLDQMSLSRNPQERQWAEGINLDNLNLSTQDAAAMSFAAFNTECLEKKFIPQH